MKIIRNRIKYAFHVRVDKINFKKYEVREKEYYI